MQKSRILFFLLFILTSSAFSQRNVVDTTVFSPHIRFSYGYQFPQADLAERFGDNSSLGFSFGIKDRKNWIYGVSAQFQFGNSVTENGLLQNLITDNGEIIDNNGQISELIISQRGYVLHLEGGKIFNIIGPNPNSGLMVTGGIGFMQHKIRIEHQLNTITQLEGEYLKGYDRLTNGLMISQFVGYYHMSDNRYLNFYLGVEAIQGFTEGRRDFNFDTQTSNEGARTDVLVGFRAGWILNFYKRSTNTIYFD